MRKSTAFGCTAALALATLAGCAGAEPPGEAGSESGDRPTPSPAEPDSTESRSDPSDDSDDSAREPVGPPPTPRVREAVAEDISTPWGMVFLEDDSALVSERNTGRILRVMRSGQVREVGTVPEVAEPPSYGEGGLLGIEFADDTLYAYRTVDGENQVVAMDYDPDRRGGRSGLGEPRVLLAGIPQDDFHNAGRIVFGPDDYLYVATGDGREPENAQDLDSLGGKILRVTPEGDPAPGNPFDDSPVWSYGHRNIEGLAFDGAGRLWASEFGEDARDELNLIEPGENYGWPEVEGMGDDGDYRNPVHVWPVEEASPAGLAYADGALWMAALRGERLWRIDLDPNADRDAAAPTRGEPKAFLTEEYGRLRTVERAPDGSLWLSTSNTDGRDSSVGVGENDDRILRVRLTDAE